MVSLLSKLGIKEFLSLFSFYQKKGTVIVVSSVMQMYCIKELSFFKARCADVLASPTLAGFVFAITCQVSDFGLCSHE